MLMMKAPDLHEKEKPMTSAKQCYRRPLYQPLLVTLLLITTALCALYATMPVAAEPAVLGSLSGVVRDRAGTPVSGIDVVLTGNSVSGGIEQRTTTDGAGRYRFGFLPAGLYRMALYDRARRYPAPQYFEHGISLQDATVITVNGDNRTDLDLIIHPGGEFHGQVTAADGRPLANVAVIAYNRSDSSTIARQGLSDSNGHYVIAGLVAGFYYLEFIDRTQIHQTKFYGDTTNYYQAIPVGVSAGGQVNELNIRLTRSSTISGQVRGSDGQPLANIRVEARTRFESLQGAADTDEQGNYLLGRLEAGQYLIGFIDPTGRYASSSYSNLEYMDGVMIGAQEAITGVNVVLAKAGMVTGLVTDARAQPVANARVRALPVNFGSPIRTTQTDAQGNYLLEGLTLDSYHMEFSGPGSLYLRSYYSNVTSLAASTPITVFPGETLTNVNATLLPGGAITGTITTVDASALGTVAISAIPQHGPLTTTISMITSVVGSQLTYTVGGLPTDAYLVAVQRFGSVEYYNNTVDEDRATPVQVTAGQLTRDINFVLGDYADAATISGTVRTPTGAPLRHVKVSVYCLDPCGYTPIEAVPVVPLTGATAEPTWRYLRATWTDAAGQYRLAGLQPQAYRLGFLPYLADWENPYTFAYYDNALDLASATVIDLLPFMVRDSLDVTLTTGGAITGVVTLDQDQPLRNGALTFHFWNGYAWEVIATTTTDQLTGRYVRPALQSGRYRVELSGSIGSEAYRYFYGNTTVLTAATDVMVTAGLTTADINLDLSPAAFLNAAITGTVSAANKPLPNIRVALYRYYGDELVSATMTDRNGHYRFPNLGENSYFVAFIDPAATYGIGYSRALTTFTPFSDDAIFVESNQVMTNVNAELALGGAIHGQVVDALGRGVGQVEVDLYTPLGTRWVKATPTLSSNADGFYQTPGLLPGRYRLRFSDPFFRFRDRYYFDHPVLERSPALTVRVDEVTQALTVTMSTSFPSLWTLYLPVVAR